MLRCYNDWVNSNRVVWPNGGTRLTEPAWVVDWFSIFEAVDELRKLEVKKPSHEGLPNVDDLFGVPPTG